MVALAVLVVLIIFSLNKYFLFPPMFTDPSFHLAAANGFNRAGGVTVWDFWEFAPTGRPLLYPPLTHLILALILKIGLAPEQVIRFFSLLINPIILFTFWSVTKKIVNSKFALLALLINLISLDCFMKNTLVWPAVLALTFSLLTFGALYKNKVTSAIIFLSLAFYSHLELGHLAAITLFILYWLLPTFRQNIKKILLCAYTLYLPYLLHLITNINYLHSGAFGPIESATVLYQNLKIFLLPMILAILTIFLYFKKIKIYRLSLVDQPPGNYFLFIVSTVWFLTMVPIALTYPDRFLNIHAWYPLSLLAALGLSFILNYFVNLKNYKPILVYLVTLLILIFFNPTLNLAGKKIINFEHTTLTRLATFPNYPQKMVDVFGEIMPQQIIKKLIATTNPTDIVAVATPLLGSLYGQDVTQLTMNDYFGALANRSTIAGGLLRIRNTTEDEIPKTLVPLINVKAIIADYTQLKAGVEYNNYYSQALATELNENFYPVLQENRLVLLLNKQTDNLLKSYPKGLVVPFWLVSLLSLVVVYFLGRDLFKPV